MVRVGRRNEWGDLERVDEIKVGGEAVPSAADALVEAVCKEDRTHVAIAKILTCNGTGTFIVVAQIKVWALIDRKGAPTSPRRTK
jgi:hypothetical protein